MTAREITLGFPQDSVDAGHRNQDLVALIRRVAGGEQSALTTLYDATNRLVFGLIIRVVGDRASAEEVLLDVYTQVWRQAAAYDTSRGVPLAWIMTIARSRAIDRLRAGRQDQQRKEPLDAIGEVSASGISPEEASLYSERQRLVRNALQTLSPEQREVIELAYYSGLSHSEIALKLSQPLGTVKTRTRLGMIKLRDMLRPILGGQV
ncbi:MAG: sigma-70 family RNA polymerase sigma factor [Blastocatellia bacterium]